MHWIYLAQEAGSHESRSEFSKVLAKLNDHQIFKEGCSIDFIAGLWKKSQQITPNQAHGVGKRQHKCLSYFLLFHPS
jgi:hypothetical protein